MIRRNCNQCGKFFWVYQHKIKNGGGKYCSKECVGKSQRKGVHINCNNCGKRFYARKSDFRRGWDRKYCSQQCYYGQIEVDKVERYCKECGNKFTIRESALDRGRGKYCSKECESKSKTIYPKTRHLRKKILADRDNVRTRIAYEAGIDRQSVPDELVSLKYANVKLKRKLWENQ